MRIASAFRLLSRQRSDSSVLIRVMALAGIAITLCCTSALQAVAQNPHYILANDDVAPTLPNSVSFFTIGPSGALTYQKKVVTSGFGIAGGYFGSNRISILDGGGTGCLYASEAGTDDITGIVISTQAVSGSFSGSPSDDGSSNGIGLATNGQYLYAGYTTSSTIGTFQIQAGCTLSFVGDTPATGLQGGTIDAMAVHGTILVATYADGSIGSFDISGGMPVSNGDQQNSTAALNSEGSTYPSSVDITQDGHFAIFGDTSTSVVAEVSDISSGSLTKTVVYPSPASISSSNIMLSPDETLLYVVDTQGDRVSAAFFDKSTGALTPGCTSGVLTGYVQNFSYLAGTALANTTGTGGMIYVAEFGGPSAIAMVQVSSSRGKCSLKEVAGSPVTDPNSSGLLSIGSFPPRPF